MKVDMVREYRYNNVDDAFYEEELKHYHSFMIRIYRCTDLITHLLIIVGRKGLDIEA